MSHDFGTHQYPYHMKRHIIANIIAGSMFFLPFASCSTPKQTANTDAGNLIIYYDPTVSTDKLLAAAKGYGSEVLYVYKNFNCIAVTVPPKRTTAKAIRFYKKVEGVLSVMEDRKLELQQ